MGTNSILGMCIAQAAAAAGLNATARDVNEELVEKGLTSLAKNVQWAVSKGKVNRDEAAAIQHQRGHPGRKSRKGFLITTNN